MCGHCMVQAGNSLGRCGLLQAFTLDSSALVFWVADRPYVSQLPPHSSPVAVLTCPAIRQKLLMQRRGWMHAHTQFIDGGRGGV